MEPHKFTILCVDDEEVPLFLRKRVLEKSGYHVVTAASGPEALDMLTRAHVDLVLSDQLMPGMTGTQLAKTIKTNFPRLPVVLISGINEVPPDSCYADAFLSKLEGPVVLHQKLAEIFTKYQPDITVVSPQADFPATSLDDSDFGGIPD